MSTKPKIGAGIALDGEKEFKKAVSGINTDLKILATEMKKVSAEFDDNKDSIQALTAKGDVLQKQYDSQADKIKKVKDALENSKEQYGENDAKTKAWQITLGNAEADLIKLDKEIGKNKDALEQAKNPTDQMADGVERFGKEADKAGGHALKMGDIIKANLISEAIIGGVKALGGALLSAGKAFGDFVMDGVQNASDLAESQNVVDVTFGDSANTVNDWSKKAAGAFGLSELQAKKYNGTMGAMLKSTGLGDDAVLEMSTSMTGLAADFASFYNLDHDEAFAKIRAGMSGETEPLKALGINLSVANLEAYALAEGIKKPYKEMSEAEKTQLRYNYLLEASADAQGDFARTSDSFANQQKIAKLNMENLATSMGSKLLPIFNEGLGVFNDMFTGSVSVSEGMATITDMVMELANELIAKIPELAKVGGEMLTSIINGIIESLPALIDAALAIVGAIGQALLDNLPTILQAGITILLSLINGITESLPELIPVMVDTVILIVETLIDNVDMLVDAAIAIVIALAEGLINALPRLIKKAPEIVQKLVDAVIKNGPKLLTAAGELIGKLVIGIIDNLPQLINAGHTMLISVRDGIIEFKDKMLKAGGDLITGLWNGIIDKKDWLIGKVKGIGGSIISAVKGVFGIHSPSTVFRDEVGKNLALGLGEGFSAEMKDVSSDMNKAIPTSFDTALNVTGSGSLSPAAYESKMVRLLEVIASKDLKIFLDGKELSRGLYNTIDDLMNSSITNNRLATGGIY